MNRFIFLYLTRETQMSYGRLIVIEGLDGVGKSTLIRNVSSELENSVVVTLPRCNDQIAKDLGQAAYAERDNCLYGLMLMTSKLIAIKKDIIPLLEKGKTVIVDRWLNSTLVYGCIRQPDLMLPMAEFVSNYPEYEHPEMVIHLNASKDQRVNRLASRDTTLDPDELHSIANHDQYSELYDGSFILLGQESILKTVTATDNPKHDSRLVLNLIGDK